MPEPVSPTITTILLSLITVSNSSFTPKTGKNSLYSFKVFYRENSLTATCCFKEAAYLESAL